MAPVGNGKPGGLVRFQAEAPGLQVDDAVLMQQVLLPLGLVPWPPDLHPPLQLHLGPNVPPQQQTHRHWQPACMLHGHLRDVVLRATIMLYCLD